MVGMVIDQVAQFDEMDVERLQKEPDMIRNTRKIRATIQNARAIQAIQTEYGSFSAYLWAFVDGQPRNCLIHKWLACPINQRRSVRNLRKS